MKDTKINSKDLVEGMSMAMEPVYRTSDGKEFMDKDKAVGHQRGINIAVAQAGLLKRIQAYINRNESKEHYDGETALDDFENTVCFRQEIRSLDTFITCLLRVINHKPAEARYIFEELLKLIE